ncbi:MULTISPECIES: RNA polymerase sigma factor [Bacillus]|uniref:RNA polymerase sigma factor n=1 Tax=Bacillus TaxID=1386 RepID=UPI000300D0A6|nr:MULTISPECIES: RNA polymerase sigma factor [Bacillus]
MNSRDVIETWFRLYEKDISRYLAYYTGGTDIEDFVQETFLKALYSLDQYRASSHPKTWLISIARNVARDSFRRNSKQHLFLNFSRKQKEDRSDSIEDQLLIDEEQRHLYRTIVKLKDSYRDVIYVKGILEMKSSECAEILGWSTNKVDVTFFRALKKLKKLLEEGPYEK